MITVLSRMLKDSRVDERVMKEFEKIFDSTNEKFIKVILNLNDSLIPEKFKKMFEL